MAESCLKPRNKTPKRRVEARLRDDRRPATQPNEAWSMNFVHGQLTNGKRIRILTVVDTFSRFSPLVDPRVGYRAEDLVAALELTCAVGGYPKVVRGDEGSEFTCRNSDRWAYASDVALDFSRPAKPTDTDVAESPPFAT